jgi:hypothetical protein
MNLLLALILGYITLFVIFFIRNKANKKKELLEEEKNQKEKERKIKEKEMQFQIEMISVLLKDEMANPNIIIKILEKDYDKRYIKIGVQISDIGIADALIYGSQIDRIRKKILIYKHYLDTQTYILTKYDIDVILIEEEKE